MKNTNRRRKSLFTTFAVLMFVAVWQGFAQTNGLATTNYVAHLTLPTDVITVYGFGSAFAALLHYAGVSTANIGYITLISHLVAKWVINYPLKNSNSKVANVISHIALEGSLPPADNSPAKETAPAQAAIPTQALPSK